MNQNILINRTKTDTGWKFDVTIVEKGSETKHTVTMSDDFYNSLNTEESPDKVIEESFRFLLEKEPKESILRSFDVTVISNYFPDYKETLINKLN